MTTADGKWDLKRFTATVQNPGLMWAGVYARLRAQAYNTDAIIRVPTC